MKIPARTIVCFLIFVLLVVCGLAQSRDGTSDVVPPKNYRPPRLETSANLQSILSTSLDDVLKSYTANSFSATDIAATLIDLRDAKALKWANVQGNEQIYPASVVKMFYMTALERQLEDGRVVDSKELERGLHDMIVDSSNEATQYILDVITGTSSGAELPSADFEKWQVKRNRVNRFFSAMGYSNININQKTFCEDAYGVEQQSRNYNGQNRNMLTTDAVARLLAEIVLGRMNTPERTKVMMDLMHREPFSPDKGDQDDQAHGFTGRLLIERKMTDAKLWSKAGWTSTARHDAAYVETTDGLKFVLVIFTEHHANEKGTIPAIAGRVIDGLRKTPH
ncbi:MAG: serine hydrolase [Acidobacteriota bacterium]